MMTIQILGTGCPRCNRLAEIADEAARRLGLQYQIAKVTDVERIVEFGAMLTPALAVDGQLRLAGAVPTVEEVMKLLA